jgi:hypothetical protein
MSDRPTYTALLFALENLVTAALQLDSIGISFFGLALV